MMWFVIKLIFCTPGDRGFYFYIVRLAQLAKLIGIFLHNLLKLQGQTCRKKDITLVCKFWQVELITKGMENIG